MTWWIWIALGVVLAAVELTTPGGFFVIFFGVSAFVVGILAFAGVIDQPWLQWLVFSALAIVAFRLFRKPLLARFQHRRDGGDVDTVVGEIAVAAAPMPPGDYAAVELRGSRWNARNVGDTPIAAGQRSRVVAVHGLMLDVVQAA
jgi:membrane protein implicated in regulation of membrane protease activity